MCAVSRRDANRQRDAAFRVGAGKGRCADPLYPAYHELGRQLGVSGDVAHHSRRCASRSTASRLVAGCAPRAAQICVRYWGGGADAACRGSHNGGHDWKRGLGPAFHCQEFLADRHGCLPRDRAHLRAGADLDLPSPARLLVRSLLALTQQRRTAIANECEAALEAASLSSGDAHYCRSILQSGRSTTCAQRSGACEIIGQSRVFSSASASSSLLLALIYRPLFCSARHFASVMLCSPVQE